MKGHVVPAFWFYSPERVIRSQDIYHTTFQTKIPYENKGSEADAQRDSCLFWL